MDWCELSCSTASSEVKLLSFIAIAGSAAQFFGEGDDRWMRAVLFPKGSAMIQVECL